MRIALSLTLVLLPVAGLLAANVVSVVQKGRAFSVPAIEVARGAVVRFVNDDLFLHQVYVDAPSFSFDTDEQEPGTTVDIAFPNPGVFEVRCHIHPKMLLQVQVR